MAQPDVATPDWDNLARLITSTISAAGKAGHANERWIWTRHPHGSPERNALQRASRDADKALLDAATVMWQAFHAISGDHGLARISRQPEVVAESPVPDGHP